MAEIEIQTGLRENTVGFVELFVDIARVDPVSAALLLVGAVLVVFTAGLVGLLAFGGVVGSLTRLFPTAPAPRQPDR